MRRATVNALFKDLCSRRGLWEFESLSLLRSLMRLSTLMANEADSSNEDGSPRNASWSLICSLSELKKMYQKLIEYPAVSLVNALRRCHGQVGDRKRYETFLMKTAKGYDSSALVLEKAKAQAKALPFRRPITKVIFAESEGKEQGD